MQEGKKGRPDATSKVKKSYVANFVDGFAIPEEAIIFAGISMRLQPKLAGRKLDAFAKLFTDSHARHKFAYLGDALQRFNSAACYIIEKLNQGLAIANPEDWKPSIFLKREKQDGNLWCESHEIKFNPDEERKVIIKDSEIIIAKNFAHHLEIAIKAYLDPRNDKFITAVDSTVYQYMTRNNVAVPKDTDKDFFRFSLDEKDPVDQCVIAFIKHKQYIAQQNKENLPYLENPAYQALLKLSYSYVIYELAGFRTAIQKIKLDHPEARNFPIYFLYPGKLNVVEEYFKLFDDVKLYGKEVDYKSVVSPTNSLRQIKVPVSQHSNYDDNIDETTSSSESPPSERELLYLLAAQMMYDRATKGKDDPLAQLRKVRALCGSQSFTATIGAMTKDQVTGKPEVSQVDSGKVVTTNLDPQ